MPQRARAPKSSPSESKNNSVSIRKITRSSVVKKSSPIKRHLEQTSTTKTQPRQKRLSSLTAATLLQYCSSILSPSRKRKSTPDNSKTIPIPNDQNIPSTTSIQPQISNNKPSQTETTIRTRREASSHASAMILQQNEIERTRYKYEHSASLIRRHNTKSTVTNKDEIPPVPPITNVSNPKYQSLTEALLVEHNRLHEKIHSKRDNLIKWTEELALCNRLSPPYPKHESPQEPSTSSVVDSNPVPSPTFLFPSTAYPLDLRSFYSLLPCWQYPTWPSQPRGNHKTSVTHLHTKKSTTSISKNQSIVRIHQRKQEAFRLHLQTNANSSSLLKSSNSTKVPSSLQKPSVLVDKEQPEATKTILPLSVNNTVQKEHQQVTLTAENEVLNLSTNSNEQHGTIKKTTRRKSSPVKRHVNGGIRSNRSPSPLIISEVPYTINSIKTSPRKTVDNNHVILSNILRTNGNSSVDDQKSTRRVLKRRSVSAAVASSSTVISIRDTNSRGNRTTSASNSPIRVISSTDRKRIHSAVSISLPLSNKTPSQRKKPKFTHYWVLFGKFEQKLVSVHADRLPVYRKCYSSIRHRTEKDVIKSNDCIILRPETDTSDTTTPYLAKVKWFWEEPTTEHGQCTITCHIVVRSRTNKPRAQAGDIQMSVIWYYHPEHTELRLHVKERFLANEVLASKYFDCVSVACIEDKCYVLNLNEYNRYCLREKPVNLFEHSEPVGQLKLLLNKNTPTVHHRPLPAKTVGNQNVFFCRYVYDYRAKRILKNPITASSL